MVNGWSPSDADDRAISVDLFNLGVAVPSHPLTVGRDLAMGGMPQDAIIAVVTETLARALDWIRKDLGSKGALNRTRAEEALAALIGSAFAKSEGSREG